MRSYGEEESEMDGLQQSLCSAIEKERDLSPSGRNVRGWFG
jgi:hypothetical protein